MAAYSGCVSSYCMTLVPPPDARQDSPSALRAGAPLEAATAAMILVHGRGASARDILTIADEVRTPGWCFLAPEAAGGQWYPNPFTAPVAANEPWLSAALGTVGRLVALVEGVMPVSRLVLLGFSQGACLTLEFAARNARGFGGVVGLSGGLIGPDDAPRDYPGSLAGTPVFLGCSDIDPYIPKERVQQAAVVLEGLRRRDHPPLPRHAAHHQ
jgi:phospholipase/carboxylesterase